MIEFEKALRKGMVCLHPTESLPGLTWDPDLDLPWKAVLQAKGRAPDKPFLALVPSLEVALTMWEPLPAGTRERLGRWWPGAVTVAWRASPAAPRSLVAPDGTLALRCPLFPEEARWFAQLLESYGKPLPSTSVNAQGAPPATSWEAARYRAEQWGFHVPVRPQIRDELVFGSAGRQGVATPARRPSTLVALCENGSWQVLRPGLVDLGPPP